MLILIKTIIPDGGWSVFLSINKCLLIYYFLKIISIKMTIVISKSLILSTSVEEQMFNLHNIIFF